MLHDAIEQPFLLNGSIKNLQHGKILTVSRKVLCGGQGSSDYQKVGRDGSLKNLWLNAALRN